MMKLLSTILTVLILTLSFSVKSHSQIEIFGISFGMNNKEIILELHRSGYLGHFEGEYGFPVQCIRRDRVLDEECLSTVFIKENPLEQCSSYIDLMRQCFVNKVMSPELLKFEMDNDIYDEYCSLPKSSFIQCMNDFKNQKKNPSVMVSLSTDSLDDSDFLWFSCQVFNGCEYTEDEIVRFLIDSTGNQFVRSENGTVEVSDGFWEGSKCMKGLKGDRLCVEKGVTDDVLIKLSRQDFGRPDMTLSLN